MCLRQYLKQIDIHYSLSSILGHKDRNIIFILYYNYIILGQKYFSVLASWDLFLYHCRKTITLTGK